MSGLLITGVSGSGTLTTQSHHVSKGLVNEKIGRTIATRLIGAEGFHALDVDYLTEHITSFCLAALGAMPPLNQDGLMANGVAAGN